MNKNINYYLQLGYPVIIRPYIDRGKKRYLAEYPDLPGCSSHGESPAKAHKMAEKAMKLWLETCIKEGIKIPEPRFIEDFSESF